MRVGPALVFLSFLGAWPAYGSDAGAIPGEVTHVATGRARFDGGWSDFRLVITGTCSPEHCFSRGRLEWVAGSIPGRSSVVKTVPVEELESVLLVRSVQFHPMRAAKPASFEIHAVNTYTGVGGVLLVSITGVGRSEGRLSGDPLGPPSETDND